MKPNGMPLDSSKSLVLHINDTRFIRKEKFSPNCQIRSKFFVIIRLSVQNVSVDGWKKSFGTRITLAIHSIQGFLICQLFNHLFWRFTKNQIGKYQIHLPISFQTQLPTKHFLFKNIVCYSSISCRQNCSPLECVIIECTNIMRLKFRFWHDLWIDNKMILFIIEV